MRSCRLLALHVEAGVDDQSFEGNSMFSLFSINITLTEEGIKHVEVVLEAIFSFLLMLKTTPIEEHRKAFMELKQIKDTSFKYREEKTSADNVEELAVNMMYFDERDILSGPDVLFEFDGALIQDWIDRLNERTFNLLLLTKKHDKYELTEKWFGTEYDEIGELKDALEISTHIMQVILNFQISRKNTSTCGTDGILTLASSLCQRKTSSFATISIFSHATWIQRHCPSIRRKSSKRKSVSASTSWMERSNCRTLSSSFTSYRLAQSHPCAKWH
jgi:hypothetical protein